MQSASLFAHQTVMFCRRMKWWHLELLLTRYVKQLTFGVSEDMLQLVEIPGVKSVSISDPFSSLLVHLHISVSLLSVSISLTLSDLAVRREQKPSGAAIIALYSKLQMQTPRVSRVKFGLGRLGMVLRGRSLRLLRRSSRQRVGMKARGRQNKQRERETEERR